MRRVASLLSTAAIFVALPALAQEQPSADPLAAGSVQQPQSAPAADTDLDQSQTGAGDIVVTARAGNGNQAKVEASYAISTISPAMSKFMTSPP